MSYSFGEAAYMERGQHAIRSASPRSRTPGQSGGYKICRAKSWQFPTGMVEFSKQSPLVQVFLNEKCPWDLPHITWIYLIEENFYESCFSLSFRNRNRNMWSPDYIEAMRMTNFTIMMDTYFFLQTFFRFVSRMTRRMADKEKQPYSTLCLTAAFSNTSGEVISSSLYL